MNILQPSMITINSPSLKDTDPELWLCLDAVVLQWIYDTISNDLLNTIIEHDSRVELAWNRLFDIFYDNKNSRALYLEQEFSRTHMEQFYDASSLLPSASQIPLRPTLPPFYKAHAP